MILGRNKPVRQWIQQLFAAAVERELEEAIMRPHKFNDKKARSQNEYRKFVRSTKKTRR